ncbi:MAG: hypothetical protein WD404_02710 [Solirubrobacterales bacterium]
MGLTHDQKALLRLLAQREEGYENIAALKGIGIEDVRAEVKAALAGLEDAGAETPPSPQAEPPRSRPAPAARAPARPRLRLPADRRRLGELLGGALVVLLVVLFATDTVSLGGGDGDEGNDAPAAATNGGQQPTQAELTAVDGSGAKGQAVFGRFNQQVALVIAAEGLPATPRGRSYAISLANAEGERVPIGAVRVGRQGQLAEQLEVPAEALGLLAGGFDTMQLSLVENGELRSALTKAQREEATPEYAGTEVLRGKVTGPIVG